MFVTKTVQVPTPVFEWAQSSHRAQGRSLNEQLVYLLKTALGDVLLSGNPCSDLTVVETVRRNLYVAYDTWEEMLFLCSLSQRKPTKQVALLLAHGLTLCLAETGQPSRAR